MVKLKRGLEVEAQVEGFAFGGKGLARVGGLVLFIERALPGQRVLARISRRKSSYAEARVIKVLQESPRAIAARCRHFGHCGGCLWQNLPYAEQLQAKRLLLQECLARVGPSGEELVLPVLPSPEIYYYRNKMEFTFAERPWLPPEQFGVEPAAAKRPLALGLHARGFYSRVVNIEECHLQSPLTAVILRQVRRFALASGLPAYNTRDHTGFWRFLLVRQSRHSGQLLVELITAPHRSSTTVASQLASLLRHEVPEISSMVHGVSAKKAQVARADSRQTLFGPGYIEEHLDELRFRISAGTFFQTNTLGAAGLLEQIAAGCALSGSEVVWDLYCGSGTIAIRLARAAARVLGLEVMPEALADARVNARLNAVANCHFLLGDIKRLLAGSAELLSRYGRPQVVVTDPPRAGMHPSVVKGLLALAPPRLVCVSCNPATLARDLQMLARVYRLLRVQPLDLFPHTPHIEAVAILEKR